MQCVPWSAPEEEACTCRRLPAWQCMPLSAHAGACLIRRCALRAQNAADQPLLITSSTGVVVINNTFASVLCYPYTFGAAYGFVPNPQPPVYVAYSSNLTFASNKYVTPANCTYGAFANPIQYDPATVTGITISS